MIESEESGDGQDKELDDSHADLPLNEMDDNTCKTSGVQREQDKELTLKPKEKKSKAAKPEHDTNDKLSEPKKEESCISQQITQELDEVTEIKLKHHEVEL